MALPSETLAYPNLTTAMLAIEKEEVKGIPLTRSTAEYVVAHNDKFKIYEPPHANNNASLHV